MPIIYLPLPGGRTPVDYYGQLVNVRRGRGGRGSHLLLLRTLTHQVFLALFGENYEIRELPKTLSFVFDDFCKTETPTIARRDFRCMIVPRHYIPYIPFFGEVKSVKPSVPGILELRGLPLRGLFLRGSLLQGSLLQGLRP